MSDKIKVAFFLYPSAFQNIGGGEVLLIKTKEALERKGIDVKLFNQWEDKLEDFDILHVFGSVKPCLGLMKIAKSKSVKVVLSPIFFSTLERSLHEYGGAKKKLVAGLKHLTKVFFPWFPSDRREMLKISDALLPNSEIEKKQLSRLFAIENKNIFVVPNCVDISFKSGDKTAFLEKYNLDNFILSVGRIEPRKNQLNLIRALKGIHHPLVIIGNFVSDYMEYFNACKKEASENVVFIDGINHHDPMLKSAYFACKCLVSQGWFETPGLVALEAGLAGANIATTSGGCTREYFDDHVEYFKPSNLNQMRRATLNAFNKEKSQSFSNYIEEHFIWDVAADKNIEIYNKLLRK